MNHMNMKTRYAVTPIHAVLVAAMVLLLSMTASATTPGITAAAPATGVTSTSTFNLSATDGYMTQPDGTQIYSWGVGCAGGTPAATFAPAIFQPLGICPTMQIPSPTLIVHEGDTVTVTLTNNLPKGVGNTSLVFPGFTVTATGGVPGLLTSEAANGGGTVTYSFVATTPGTRAYFSGTQTDLQVEMGIYGAIVVIPTQTATFSNCNALGSDNFQKLGINNPGGVDFRLAPAAYDHPETCYDREYLFQFMELDPVIHRQAEVQKQAIASCVATTGAPACPTALNVKTEPYHPRYFLINGRSMPDDMDPDYAPNYPNQPYNGNPHMHPGDLTLLRTIGQGHWEHPFHEHANHVRILGRDGNLILSQNDTQVPARLGGRMEFTTDTYPGQAYDGIFYWSGKGLGWDIYGHTPGSANEQPCIPDANGYYSSAPITASNYYEWCGDHNHPLEANPAGGSGSLLNPITAPCPPPATGNCTTAGQIGGGGPATQFDPLVATNGLWYNGTPYLGHTAVENNRGATPLVVGSASQNPLAESGLAFMWHSHNEREITTNDVFPGGMLMMMLVDPSDWYIDETL
jgi:FtsP/CotA-like multicopper oxidase with cupredoxin domain